MSTKTPELISDTNLSHAWGRALLATMERSKKDMTPLTVSIGGFKDCLPQEDFRIRKVLDSALTEFDGFNCDVSASVIFPYKHWRRGGRPSSSELFDWYLNQFLPRLKARDPRNRNGTYFERMIAFQGVKQVHGRPEILTKNQLEHIISDWHRDREHPRRPRQSALQVACFDPAKDHTGQSVRGFPCLQQVSFTYDDDNGLAVNAYYPTQYIFDRAYGNYLGLCHLGHFMASELGLILVRLNCFIGHPELGSIRKSQLHELSEHVREILHNIDTHGASGRESATA